MICLVSASAEDKLLKKSQAPGYGYGPITRYQDTGDIYHERQPDGAGGGGGTAPWSRVNNPYRERVMDYKQVMDEGMKDEWGEDKGAKPKGTQVIKKKKKKKTKKKRKNDLGLITEYERINRTDPKFVGRVQKHWRRKNDYSPGKTPPNNRGGWPHHREIWPKLPSWEPETWEERTNRDMYL